MNVFWLEQTESDLPQASNWLGPREQPYLAALRFPKRRADWRLGRWTAKRAIVFCLGIPSDPSDLAQLEIIAAASGQPEAFYRSVPAAVSISLSHRAGTALCAVALSRSALGCDLERVESHGNNFVADYFSAEEQALVMKMPLSERAFVASLLWSAKESALKALHQGLRLDTRSVRVEFDSGVESSDCANWFPLRVRYSNGPSFQGCWSRSGDWLRTIVAATPPTPIALTPNSNVNDYSDFLPIPELLNL